MLEKVHSVPLCMKCTMYFTTKIYSISSYCLYNILLTVVTSIIYLLKYIMYTTENFVVLEYFRVVFK